MPHVLVEFKFIVVCGSSEGVIFSSCDAISNNVNGKRSRGLKVCNEFACHVHISNCLMYYHQK